MYHAIWAIPSRWRSLLKPTCLRISRMRWLVKCFPSWSWLFVLQQLPADRLECSIFNSQISFLESTGSSQTLAYSTGRCCSFLDWLLVIFFNQRESYQQSKGILSNGTFGRFCLETHVKTGGVEGSQLRRKKAQKLSDVLHVTPAPPRPSRHLPSLVSLEANR